LAVLNASGDPQLVTGYGSSLGATMRDMKLALVMAVLMVCAAAFLGAQAAPTNPVTEISADLGPCSAEFHITDMAGNGIYNANIHTLIRYGFMSKRKLELDAGTNSDGRARFIKLPAELKKPVEFTVSNGADRAVRNYDPAADCHVQYDVPLRTKGK
jgi:hypothetical protein